MMAMTILENGRINSRRVIEKQSKKIVANTIEAEEADNDAFTAKVDAAIKRRNNYEVAATAVAKKKDLAKENVEDS